MDDPVAMYLSDACTLPVNMAGLPGISVPCGLSEGLPVGLQLIGAPWSEAALLGLARGYEAITAAADWRAVEPLGTGRVALIARPADIGPSGTWRGRRPRRSILAEVTYAQPVSMLAGVAVGHGGRDRRLGSPPWRRTWGIDPDETTQALPGDDVVTDPVASETRGITIDGDRRTTSGRGSCRWASARPAGTATTSSTSAAQSSDEIVEAWGELKVGDIVPTHPGGGFEVVEIEPGRAWSCARTPPS